MTCNETKCNENKTCLYSTTCSCFHLSLSCCQILALHNTGFGVLACSGCSNPPFFRSGGACTAAAFLREFVTAPHWAHLDIAGVMSNKDEIPYLRKGMSGRPTRTLVEFAAGLAQDC